VVQGCNVTRDLRDIVERNSGSLAELEQQQVRERRLRPLDLRRKQRLLADVAVEEERRVRQKCGQTVEPPECQEGLLEEQLKLAIETERRNGGQLHRDEGAHLLASHGRGFVPPDLAALHARRAPVQLAFTGR